MPTGISALAPNGSFTGKDQPPSFTILQKDGLDSSLPLLHVNEHDEQLTNGLDNPRNDLYSNRKRISRSNDHLVLASLQSGQANPLRRRQSRSQESLNSSERVPIIKPSMTLSTEDFNEILNARLRKIQESGNDLEQARKCSRRCQGSPRKKPFITTVKSGEFLMPPPEVAALLGIAPNPAEQEDSTDLGGQFRSRFKPLVSLKRPEVRHSSHNARCTAALKATVDFTLGMMNATTMAAGNLEERARIAGRRNEADSAVPFGNIMFDRRVARGSTCVVAASNIDGDQSIAARQAEARRRHLARKRAQAQATKTLCGRLGSPPPVPGRRHEPVQTETYLQELFEKPDELEAGTQTDYFLDRPATPRYCPGKVGQDVCTQIEPGELFDFDKEVQPILEVLVGKTIEQSLIEVLEEEEIAALKEQQRRFLELRAAEKAEERRLEEQERRLREEKDQRVRQHEDALRAERKEEERVAAATLLTGYIAELLPAVLEGLKMSGFLLDEIKADVEDGFVPWLMREVRKEMGNVIESRELLMEIIRDILENRAEAYRKLGEEYDASRMKEMPVDENTENGQADPNFVNYEPPTVESTEAV